MMKFISEVLVKVNGYSHSQRIVRLIEIHVKGSNATFSEIIEHVLIQQIREKNGEIAAVKKSNEFLDSIENN